MKHQWASLWLAFWLCAIQANAADTIRIATFNAELQRDGPGLLLRDISRGKDKQIAAVVEVIRRTHPDILALQGFDWDHENRALNAVVEVLERAGVSYQHVFALKPNSGVASGLDLNVNGRLGEAADAIGYGLFTGHGGLAVLSRFPIWADRVASFTNLKWRDLPGHIMPTAPDGAPFPSQAAQDVLSLSSSAHWAIPIQLLDGTELTLLTWKGAPPVFDGPEDMNGRRNHDETRLWSLFLSGELGSAPARPFVLAGSATMDPNDSDGRPDALRVLLTDPALQDPEPRSSGGADAPAQGHVTDSALDTVDWPAPGPGRLRVDYVLPSADLMVEGKGVFWPLSGQPGYDAALSASRHRLVWVDITP